MCIDSGATANTIDYATYEAISAAKTVLFKQTSVKLRLYGEDNPSQIPLAGSFFGIINIYSVRANGPDQVPGTQSTKNWLSPES